MVLTFTLIEVIVTCTIAIRGHIAKVYVYTYINYMTYYRYVTITNTLHLVHFVQTDYGICLHIHSSVPLLECMCDILFVCYARS